MKQNIAYLGLGSMGASMASRLLAAGHSVTVWNRSPEKAAALIADSARVADDPAAAVGGADFVFSMVADDHALDAITFGERGILAALKPGATHVSMSSILPVTAQRLAQAHAERGSAYVSAPVFGRPAAAAAGQLWICLSGADGDKARVLPLLATLCQQHYDFGTDPAAANVVKLAGNFMIAAAIESMAEAFVLAEKNGLDPRALNDFFSNTMFACTAYRNYGKIIAERQFEPAGFRLALGRKDVQLVAETARASAVPMPFLGTLVDRYAARVARGGSEQDWAAIAIDVAHDAGLKN